MHISLYYFNFYINSLAVEDKALVYVNQHITEYFCINVMINLDMVDLWFAE